MKPAFGHVILFLLVWLVFLNGCTSWRPATVPPDETTPSDLRVALKDSHTIELTDAYVRADTLLGFKRGADVATAIPMSDVLDIEEKRVSPAKTVALVGGVAAGLAVIHGVTYFVIGAGMAGLAQQVLQSDAADDCL